MYECDKTGSRSYEVYSGRNVPTFIHSLHYTMYTLYSENLPEKQ